MEESDNDDDELFSGVHGFDTGHGLADILRRGSRFDADEKMLDKEDEEKERMRHQPRPLTARGAPVGCITVHVKHCKDFNKSSAIKKGTQGFLRLSVGGLVKCTSLQPYKDPKAGSVKFPLSFNEWKYFSVEIPKEYDSTIGISEREQLTLELIFFEQNSGVPKLTGKCTIKLLDIMNKSNVKTLLELRLKRQIICKVELDMVMAYGSLGFGYSHQLRHPKKDMASFVERSLFLRCPPPEDRKDPDYNVITPLSMTYADYIGALKYKEQKNPGSKKVLTEYPSISPVVLQHLQKRGRLMHLHESMEKLDSNQAVSFLERLVMTKGPAAVRPLRTNKRVKVLSKWKKKVTMIQTLQRLDFKTTDPAKQKQKQEPVKSILLKAALEKTQESPSEKPTTSSVPLPESPASVGKEEQTEPSFSTVPFQPSPLSPLSLPTVPQTATPPAALLKPTWALGLGFAGLAASQSPLKTSTKHVSFGFGPLLGGPAAASPQDSSAETDSMPVQLPPPFRLNPLREEKEEQQEEEKKEGKDGEEGEEQLPQEESSLLSLLLGGVTKMSLSPERQDGGRLEYREREYENKEELHLEDQPLRAGPGHETVAAGETERPTWVSGSEATKGYGWSPGSSLGGRLSMCPEWKNEDWASMALPLQTEVKSPPLLGAWTDTRTTEPVSRQSRPDSQSPGSASAQLGHDPTFRHLLSPPSTLPPTLSRSPLPMRPLASPNLDSWGMDALNRRWELHSPFVSTFETERSVERRPFTSHEMPSSYWFNNDEPQPARGSLSALDMSPLRSGLVNSPLDPLSHMPSTAKSPSGSAPGRASRARDRLRSLDSSPYPSQRRNRESLTNILCHLGVLQKHVVSFFNKHLN